MSRIQQIGSTAAFLNAALGITQLLVVLVLIGPAVMADRNLFVDMALHNPFPLFLQDGLKLIAAAVALALIWALYQQLASLAPTLLKVAAAFGVLAVIALVVNACLSLYATTQAANAAQGEQLNGLIGLLALAAIFLNGPWYLLVSWVGLKAQWLPKALNYVGLALGALSLLPFLAILVLLLSLVWSVWLGVVFRKPMPA